MRKETQTGDEQEPVAVAFCLEEIEVAAGLLVHKLKAECFSDLGIFELNNCVLRVSVRMERAQDVQSFIIAILGDQPSGQNQYGLFMQIVRSLPRGFRNEENKGKLDDGWNALTDGWDSPRPVVADLQGTEGEPSVDYEKLVHRCWKRDRLKLTDCAQVPKTVVDGRNASSVLWMANLSQEERRGELSHAVAETHEETSAFEHGKVLGSTLNCSGDNHNDTSYHDTCFATVTICEEGDDWQASDTADTVERSQETEIGAFWTAKIIVPLVLDADIVQHGTVVARSC